MYYIMNIVLHFVLLLWNLETLVTNLWWNETVITLYPTAVALIGLRYVRQLSWHCKRQKCGIYFSNIQIQKQYNYLF